MSSSVIKKQLSIGTATGISDDRNAIYVVTVKENAINGMTFTDIFKYWFAGSHAYTHFIKNNQGSRYIIAYKFIVIDNQLTIEPENVTKININNEILADDPDILEGKLQILNIKRIA